MKRERCNLSIAPAYGKSALPVRARSAARCPMTTNQAAIEARLTELLPQVRYIAHRIHSRLPAHVPFDDLLQAGVLGLLDALRKFDPGRKVQIESYMKFRIRGAILDELRSLDWSPRELRRKARRLDEVEQQLRARLGREPMAGELAKGLGISLAQFHHLTGEIRGLDLGSLQDVSASTEDGAEQEMSSRLASPEATSPLTMFSAQEQRTRLEEGIRRLPEKERLALTLYYFEELTMKEVGEVLAVGESRVSQIHSAALERLRGFLDQSVDEHPAEKCDTRPQMRTATRAPRQPLARAWRQARSERVQGAWARR